MSNPRQLRLQGDYEKLKQLLTRTHFVTIESVKGTPPAEYILHLTCRGVERLNAFGNPEYREDHRIQIGLGPTYPNEKPTLRWLTPIFHPNISSQGNICIGNSWIGGGRYLDDLVTFLLQMCRYEGEDLAFSNDAYNPAAYKWAVNHRSLLPVDKRPLYAPGFSINVRRV